MSRAHGVFFASAFPALLAVALSACGGARAQPATAAASGDPEPSVVASAPIPCTVWDEHADPSVAPRDVAHAPEQARRSISGLRWCVMRPGDGNARPTPTDQVTVHYTGWTTDGRMFDSSRARGEPATFPLNAVIRGWTEGVQLMTVGEVRRLWIPESLAYGGQGSGPRGVLVFDIELIAIVP